ncbi:helix-turn-helix transcriptional regulator [Chengkuizengella axinellae]|uniref:Helix-turn-helix transcriptional regulator n=1 Tax=Chengkuizengella axinellae TaxID=3064388 RepID=A0ABT9J458_9BACL|nr:helix-turn-helix transcriptional regulator [Chengkuizengella sp. 2205SS18-9]MDP5276380.1 helix-turn-helix transcriptional regulator [Chengkuizengella sp. 2205SS18-9]
MEVETIELTSRQLKIIEIVQENVPITGDQIAELIGVSKPTIRSDLSVLVMLGYLEAKPKVGYFPGKSALPNYEAAKKLEQIKVKDIQSIPIVVKETTTVHDAVVTLFMDNVGSLIVADDEGTLKGVLSRKDLLKVTLGNPASSTMPVHLVMTRQPNIVTIHPEQSVVEAAKKMIEHDVDTLPVISEKDEIIGRITKTNMTRLLLDLTDTLL